MRITIAAFQGRRPKRAAHLLAETEAQTAVNVDQDSGEARPLHAPLKVADVGITTLAGFFRWAENGNGHWPAFASDVDAAKGPVADDTFERVYFTGMTEPRFFANDNVSSPFDPATDYIKLGVPAPSAALSAAGYTTGSGYRAWVHTYVTRYGDEGPPSPLTEISNYASGNVTLSGFASAPPASRAIDRVRVYRVNASGAGYNEFQLVFAADIYFYSAAATYNIGDLVTYGGALFVCMANGTTGVTPSAPATEWDAKTDDVADVALQPDVLESEGWDPPPAGLTGLVMLPNGVAAGFVGKTVYLSEPNLPHAWPAGNQHPLPENVVALAVDGSALVVMTTGPTYMMSGGLPEQMTPIKLAGLYPCVSKRGAASSPMGTFYPAEAGLIRATANGLECVTKTMDLLAQRDWAAYLPATMHGVFHDNKYIGFYGASGGFIIDFSGALLVDLDWYADDLYEHPEDGKLYLVKDDAIDPENPPATIPLAVFEWGADPYNFLYYRWASKLFIPPAATCPGAARLELDDTFFGNIEEILAANAAIALANAALFAAGVIGGGLAARGLNVYGLNADALQSPYTIFTGTTVTFRYYADGQLKLTKVLSTSVPFRLPGGFRTRRIELAVEGYTPVKAIVVASGMEELIA